MMNGVISAASVQTAPYFRLRSEISPAVSSPTAYTTRDSSRSTPCSRSPAEKSNPMFLTRLKKKTVSAPRIAGSRPSGAAASRPVSGVLPEGRSRNAPIAAAAVYRGRAYPVRRSIPPPIRDTAHRTTTAAPYPPPNTAPRRFSDTRTSSPRYAPATQPIIRLARSPKTSVPAA